MKKELNQQHYTVLLSVTNEMMQDIIGIETTTPNFDDVVFKTHIFSLRDSYDKIMAEGEITFEPEMGYFKEHLQRIKEVSKAAKEYSLHELSYDTFIKIIEQFAEGNSEWLIKSVVLK